MATSIQMEQKTDENDHNVLLVQTKENSSSVTSRYQHSENVILSIIEWIRWKLNIILLFKPFAFLSHIPIKYHFHQFLYRMTIAEIMFYVVLIIIAYPQTVWFLQTLSQKPILIWGSTAIADDRRRRLESGDGGENENGEESGQSAQIWFVITWILSLRNTAWNLLFGFSFERAVTFHRIIGRFAIIMGFYHFWVYRNYDWFAGRCYSGSIALIAAIAILITSLNIFRRKIFTIFFKLHWIGIGIFTYYSFIHEASLMVFPILLTIIDFGFRWYKTFGKPVIIKELRLLSGNVIRIVFDKKNFKYQAGQYVFICIPAIDFTQYHPFSISSSPHHDQDISIHIRVLGDWTSKLRKLAAYYQENNNDINDSKFNLTCFMEGPYGELQIPLYNDYESIVMISGGIGITPLQSLFNEIVHNISSNNSKIKRIHFVWTVRDPSIISEFDNRHWSGIQYKDIMYYNDKDQSRLPSYFSPDLLIVKEQETVVQRTDIITHFYLTRVIDQNIVNQYTEKYNQLKFGRPSIENILKDASNDSKKVCVLSCGPKSMLKDVKKYATKYAIDCHTEIFQF